MSFRVHVSGSLPAPSSRIIDTYLCLWLFTQVLDIWTQVLMLDYRHFTHRAISSLAFNCIGRYKSLTTTKLLLTCVFSSSETYLSILSSKPQKGFIRLQPTWWPCGQIRAFPKVGAHVFTWSNCTPGFALTMQLFTTHIHEPLSPLFWSHGS